MTEYERKYREAYKPGPTDLIGTWEVTVLSGALPDMRRLGHVKVIKPRRGMLRGYNRTLLIRWGKFTVSFCKDCAMFLYGKVAFFDRVRKVDGNLLIGEYKIQGNDGKYRASGYFQMRRK